MQLNKIDDPRDALSKATRYQVYQWAKANGLTATPDGIPIEESTPAPLIRMALRARGLSNIPVALRVLGATGGPVGSGGLQQPGEKVQTVNADADLAEQYRRQQARERQDEAAAGKSLADMGINELRQECGRLGIKLGRRDNMQSIREKIAAHGQNAA